MQKVCTPLLLFALFTAAPSTFGASLVLLGTNRPATLTAFPSLHTLKAFEGRIYIGYGDWDLYPAVVVTSYQPEDGSFHLEFSAYTDSIGIFREIGGRLYVPSIDPVHFQDFHDLSYRSGGIWRDHSPVGMYHVLDIATLTGNDLWITGAKSVNDTTNDNACVFRSLDGGRTWEDKTIQSSQFRYYWGFPLRGNFYVRDTVYTNGVGTRVTAAPYELLFKPTPVGEGDGQFIVGLAQRTPGIRLTSSVNLVTYDGSTWRVIRPAVYDFALSGSNLYMVELQLGGRQLRKISSLSATQAVSEPLGFINVPQDPICVEVMGDVIYVGDDEGRLWAGRLDGGELVPPAPIVVNELSDDFGRALSIDGDTLAVGAPDHSGSNYLCGQVTIWQNLPTEGAGTQWTQTAVIDPPQPSFSGWFGKEVLLKDDVLLVAETGRDTARYDRGMSAQVHLYQRTLQGWALRQTLNHSYAHSVATDGELLIVGGAKQFARYRLARAADDTLSAMALGSTSITPPSSVYEPTVRVAVESNIFVVALSGDVSRYGGPGELRIYERLPSGTIVLTNVLRRTWTAPPRGAPLKPDRFGFSIALKNGWLAVGAPRDDTVAMQSGAVFLYQWTTLTNGASFLLKQVIDSPSAQVEAAFGASVALTDSRLIVGSPGTETAGQRHHGSAYVYQLAGTNWIQIGQASPPVNSTGEFGSRVAAGTNWMAVASRFSDFSTNIEERILILPHLAPFDLWTTFHGLTGSDALASSDADGDGANNLGEYACNLDPQLADAVPVYGLGNKGLPAAQLERVGNDSYLNVIQIRRRDFVSLGLNYTLETSDDLQNWTPSSQQPSSVVQVDPEWERITYRFPLVDGESRFFCRIRTAIQ